MTRWLWVGLWTIANYRGNLEYRPKRIKAQVLPYDDCDIEQLLNDLNKSRLITIYSVQEQKYINITNFIEHQNPHKNEKAKGTNIPEMPEGVDFNEEINNRDLSRLNREYSASDPADSCFLIPDSCSPIPDLKAYLASYENLGELHQTLKQFIPEVDLIRPKERAMMNEWLTQKITSDVLKTAIERAEYQSNNFGVGYLNKIIIDLLNPKTNTGGSGNGRNSTLCTKPAGNVKGRNEAKEKYQAAIGIQKTH